MDDGLIYGHSEEEVMEKLRIFKEACQSIGIEVNKAKSGWIRKGTTALQDFKFLGITKSNVTSITEAPFEESSVDKLISKTRSGTRKELGLTAMPYDAYKSLVMSLGYEEIEAEKVIQEHKFYTNKGVSEMLVKAQLGVTLKEQLTNWWITHYRSPEEALDDCGVSNTRIRDWVTNRANSLGGALEWCIRTGKGYIPDAIMSSEGVRSESLFTDKLKETAMKLGFANELNNAEWMRDKGLIANVIQKAFEPEPNPNSLSAELSTHLGITYQEMRTREGIHNTIESIFQRQSSIAMKAAISQGMHMDGVDLSRLSSYSIARFSRVIRRSRIKRGKVMPRLTSQLARKGK